MEINELYNIIYKEEGSEIVAATIVVRDQNQKDVRVYSMNEYGGMSDWNIDEQ